MVGPTVRLNNGKKFPVLGLGTWKSQPGQVTQAVKDAIDLGYRHIDCAYVYGNETEVGEAIKTKVTEKVVKREDLFVTSKVWNTFHSRDLVFKLLKETLQNLGLTYLDLYLIHWPMGYKENAGTLFPKDGETWLFSDVDYLETWKALEDCVKQGLVRAIGLSNFNSQQIDRVIAAAEIQPAVLQVEVHPYLNQQKLIDFCKSRDIVVTAYSPLGSPDRPWAKPDDPLLLEDPRVVQLAKKYNKSPAQILLRYPIDRGVSVIPKSVTKERIKQNADLFDFQLDAADITALNALDCNGRALHEGWASDHQYYPFKIEF